ncbi:MAG: tripartite tricarboxylate transporter substrate binding protein [Burkholderiales bacterium]|nr:tripartite tricarboxylate transporter substrate binding protein [Burkholderiales bacterium]
MNRSCLLTAIAVSSLSFTAGAANDFPTRPIRLIVPFAPGGGTDIIGRILANQLHADLKQTVVVDNRPGAGSVLGHALAAEAEPDGHTLVFSSISFAINAVYHPRLSYATVTAFTPVTRVADQPNILVVNPRVEARSVKELVDLAKRQPGKLNYGSAGNGTGTQFAAELLKMKAGIEMQHVPYKGTGPALNDLVAGNIQLYISTLASAVPFIQQERVRALAVTSERRSKVVPEVPTMQEAGIAGYTYETWYGVQVPRATPRPIVEALNRIVVRAVQSPQVQAQMERIGIEPVTTSPQQFASFIRTELDKWGGVVRTAGLAAR